VLFRFKQALSYTLAVALLLLAGSPLAPTALAYSDDAGGWYSETIQKAADYGLMEGYPDGSFGVGDDMTRAEFVTVLGRMFGWEAVTPEVPTFSDCPADKWYFSAVETAAAQGVTEVTGAFRPNEPISRGDIAAMLVRALGYGDLAAERSAASLPFSDVEGHPLGGYIAMAYHFGITNGIEGPEGQLMFLPDSSAPREQCAAMLVRAYERLQEKTQWLHGFYAFSSYSQLELGLQMDGVSLGWARMSYDSDQGFYLNTTRSKGNDWAIPENPNAALDKLNEAQVPYNLNVYADAAKNVTLPDGSKTSVLALLLSSPDSMAQAAQALADISGPYAGITIDFEGLTTDTYRDALSGFMEGLRAALPQDKTLYICVPPDKWYKGYDYRALGESCDKVILMAHDYQFPSIPKGYLGTNNTYSPVTPLSEVYTALQHLVDSETGVQDRSKAALQISFGTAGFHVDENGLLLDTTIYHPASETIAKRLGQEDSVRQWDEYSRNPCLNYTVGDARYLLWYEDAQSVQEKLRLARLLGVSGVSVWRLGLIPTFSEQEQYDVWSVFADR